MHKNGLLLTLQFTIYHSQTIRNHIQNHPTLWRIVCRQHSCSQIQVATNPPEHVSPKETYI